MIIGLHEYYYAVNLLMTATLYRQRLATPQH